MKKKTEERLDWRMSLYNQYADSQVIFEFSLGNKRKMELKHPYPSQFPYKITFEKISKKK